MTGVDTIGMKIVEIIVISAFAVDRKKNDDRMFQTDVALESNRLFEEPSR